MEKFTIFDCIIQSSLAVSDINAWWKATWPECVENKAEFETLTLCNDIIALAHQIGGGELNYNDLEDMFEDIPLINDEIFNTITTENDEHPERD